MIFENSGINHFVIRIDNSKPTSSKCCNNEGAICLSNKKEGMRYTVNSVEVYKHIKEYQENHIPINASFVIDQLR